MCVSMDIPYTLAYTPWAFKLRYFPNPMKTGTFVVIELTVVVDVDKSSCSS